MFLTVYCLWAVSSSCIIYAIIISLLFLHNYNCCSKEICLYHLYIFRLSAYPLRNSFLTFLSDFKHLSSSKYTVFLPVTSKNASNILRLSRNKYIARIITDYNWLTEFARVLLCNLYLPVLFFISYSVIYCIISSAFSFTIHAKSSWLSVKGLIL